MTVRGTPGRTKGAYSMPVQDEARLIEYARKQDMTKSQVIRRALHVFWAIQNDPATTE
jgi:hypothetical protein